MLKKIKRILVKATKKFFEDDCYNKASSLTFYTLEFIVPFLALLYGIAKGFGFEEFLRHLITTTFVQEKEAFSELIQFANSLLQRFSQGVLIGTGTLYLLFVNFDLLGATERALNSIWRIRVHRTFIRQVVDYFAIIILCPLTFIATASLTVYVKSEISRIAVTTEVAWYELFQDLDMFLNYLIQLSPFIFSWVLVFLIYILIPNAKLRIWPLIICAIIAGTIFQFWQMLFIYLQVSIFKYNIIYGAFAIIPLLLIWLQYSWMIILAGAECAAVIEYEVEEMEPHIRTKKISSVELRFVVLYECLEAFFSGLAPPSDTEIAKKLHISLDVTRDILEALIKEKIIAPTEVARGKVGYLPAADPDSFTIKKVRDILISEEQFEIMIEETEPVQKITEILTAFDEEITGSEKNLPLSSLFIPKNR